MNETCSLRLSFLRHASDSDLGTTVTGPPFRIYSVTTSECIISYTPLFVNTFQTQISAISLISITERWR